MVELRFGQSGLVKPENQYWKVELRYHALLSKTLLEVETQFSSLTSMTLWQEY